MRVHSQQSPETGNCLDFWQLRGPKRQKEWLAFTLEARLSIQAKFRTTMWVAAHLRFKAATLTCAVRWEVGPQPHLKLWVSVPVMC